MHKLPCPSLSTKAPTNPTLYLQEVEEKGLIPNVLTALTDFQTSSTPQKSTGQCAHMGASNIPSTIITTLTSHSSTPLAPRGLAWHPDLSLFGLCPSLRLSTAFQFHIKTTVLWQGDAMWSPLTRPCRIRIIHYSVL